MKAPQCRKEDLACTLSSHVTVPMHFLDIGMRIMRIVTDLLGLPDALV